MNKILMLMVMMGLGSLTYAQETLSNWADSASYALGMDIGNNLKRMGAGKEDVNLKLFYQGLLDVLTEGNTPLLDDQKSRILATDFVRKIQQIQLEEAQARADAFMAENSKKEGVFTLESGLQYKVLVNGEPGPSPTASDQVEVHYEGRLIDGTVFDSSYQRGEPITFGVNGVIQGWTEALQLMKPGDKWQLFIPPQLGYGQRGAPPKIGPNEVLIFDVELLGIK
ncbi:MAG: FKBP-type peptidyl-prolyl cis-trans isomerase [Bacteroidetes bacterium]|nr:MAG: FKBP-type peptidyl-prolyl cis-trans isomerase [Bacteroidota bacterium]